MVEERAGVCAMNALIRMKSVTTAFRVWRARELEHSAPLALASDLPLMGKRRPHAAEIVAAALASISFIKLNVASRRVSVVFGYS